MTMTEPQSASRTVRARGIAPRRTGTMEMIPKWLNLVPMVLQWAWLGLRYRSFTLPSAANPAITTGGLVGDSKSEYFDGMGPLARASVAPYAVIKPRGSASMDAALAAMDRTGLAFPIVAKPDLGWCGFGVRKVDDADALADYLARFPDGAALMLQQYRAEPGEAGIFYVREPGAERGHFLGILLRYFPQVIGDGASTLGELIDAQPRLRHAIDNPLHECRYEPYAVPAHGEVVRLSLIGSTRAGGRYEDGSELATETLLDRIEAIARDMPQFHVGRFDVRFATTQDLREGRFSIMEVNGAGSEAVHAWDPKYTLAEVYRMVFAKQRVLFELGAAQRAQGHKPTSAIALARHYLKQQRLIRQYPPSN